MATTAITPKRSLLRVAGDVSDKRGRETVLNPKTVNRKPQANQFANPQKSKESHQTHCFFCHPQSFPTHHPVWILILTK